MRRLFDVPPDHPAARPPLVPRLFDTRADEVSWCPRYGPEPAIRWCQHDCAHGQRAVIGHGRDMVYRDYVQCDVPGGCHGTCRAWVTDSGVVSSPWLEVVRLNLPR